MPKLSVIDACQQIRLLGYDGVIIAVTGNVLLADKDEFLSAGADFFLVFPLVLRWFSSICVYFFMHFEHYLATFIRTKAMSASRNPH
jgi:CheY-like chemotaxis protein